VVLDSRLRTPLDSQLVRSAHDDLMIFCDEQAATNRASALQAAGVTVERIAQQGGRLDLNAVLAALAARQILGVLLECGSELNGAFLAQNLVDKVVLFHAPTALEAGAIPFAAGFGSPSLLEQSLKKMSRTNFGADTCVAGVLRDPWG
jgi:diaminohydroxyphosphoribosylaminopyrimidine deaminase/5-amino-6-(5-phosphoribosylamino)uracil reductase